MLCLQEWKSAYLLQIDPFEDVASDFCPPLQAIPDVSAQSDFFRIWYRGRAVHIGGTSASSPAFAGFVALLNDARLRKGQPALGFLNPLLYSKGVAGFNDITTGNAPGCGTPGFNATKGWDPGKSNNLSSYSSSELTWRQSPVSGHRTLASLNL